MVDIRPLHNLWDTLMRRWLSLAKPDNYDQETNINQKDDRGDFIADTCDFADDRDNVRSYGD